MTRPIPDPANNTGLLPFFLYCLSVVIAFFFAPELLRYLCLSFAIGRWCQEQSTVISVCNGDNFDRFKLNTDPSCLF